MAHDLNLAALAVISACVVVWGLVSARLERWNVSAPIAFVVLGLVATHGPSPSSTSTCTRRPSAPWPRSRWPWCSSPTRPGSTSIGSAPTWRNPSVSSASGCRSPSEPAPRSPPDSSPAPGSGWPRPSAPSWPRPMPRWGRPCMEDERVPARVRRVLNVESGLNDGIATPFVNLFLAGAATAEAVHGASSVAMAALDLLGGAGIGIGVGLLGALLMVAGPHSATGASPVSARWPCWRWRSSPTPPPCWPAPTGSWPHSSRAWRSAPRCPTR